MRSLSKALGAYFSAGAPRRGDPSRKARELAKSLAAQLGVEVERLRGGGFNVWPPRELDDKADPFAGDHYAADWDEVLEHVQGYAALPASSTGAKG